MAANGDAIVAWEQDGRIVARVRRASTGIWGPPRYISGQIPLEHPDAEASFDMKTNAQGDAEFAWLQSHERTSRGSGVRALVVAHRKAGTEDERRRRRMLVARGSRCSRMAPRSWRGPLRTARPAEPIPAFNCTRVRSRRLRSSGQPRRSRPLTRGWCVGPSAWPSTQPARRCSHGGRRINHRMPLPAPTRCSRVVVRGRSATGEFARDRSHRRARVSSRTIFSSGSMATGGRWSSGSSKHKRTSPASMPAPCNSWGVRPRRSRPRPDDRNEGTVPGGPARPGR